MSKGIDLAIAADTRSAMSAIQRGLIDPLEDVAELLEDVGSEGTDAGRDLERGMRDAQRKTADTADEIKEVRDALNRAGRAGKDAGDDVRAGMSRAEDGVRDLKDEANSTARESAASFDGSAESIGDAFQEIAANAFSGFGPAGAAAGLQAAAGIGLAAAGFEDVAAQQEASEQAVGEWADAHIEAGGRVLSASQVAASAREIITDPEKWKTAQKNAELWGTSVETAVLAAAGNASSIDAVNASLDAQRDAFTEAAAAGKLNSEERDKVLAGLAEANTAYVTLTDGITKGKAAANVYSQSLLDLITTTKGASVQTDELGNAVYTLPGGKQILVDAKTGEASENIDGFKGDLATVPSEVATYVRVRVDASDWERWKPTIKTGEVKAKPVVGRYWE